MLLSQDLRNFTTRRRIWCHMFTSSEATRQPNSCWPHLRMLPFITAGFHLIFIIILMLFGFHLRLIFMPWIELPTNINTYLKYCLPFSWLTQWTMVTLWKRRLPIWWCWHCVIRLCRLLSSWVPKSKPPASMRLCEAWMLDEILWMICALFRDVPHHTTMYSSNTSPGTIARCPTPYKVNDVCLQHVTGHDRLGTAATQL